VTSDYRFSDYRFGAALRAVARHVVIVAVIAFIAFPVLWAVLTSFKAPSEIYSLSPLARHPTLANYRVAITQFPLARLLLNTTVMAAGVTAGLAARLGWVDSYLGLIVPQIAACAFGVMLLRQHIQAIPASLVESAKLDGASHRQVLTLLVIPLLRPAISALAVLVFLSSWNEYLWPLLVASGSGNSTIQVGLALFQTQQGSEYGPMMAAATITTLPVLIVYLLNQRRVTDAFLRAGLR
jgi:ABC-type glycerol-3-phosphate transport system permease component